MVNYGISYGISAFGLSQRLGIPRGDAKALIDGYFAQYPGIRHYMTETVEHARETRLRRDDHRPPPLPARPPLRQRRRARRRRTQRDQHADPGFRRRPDQARHGENRQRRPRGKLAHAAAPHVHDELVFDLYQPEEKRVVEAVQDPMKNALPDSRCPSWSRPASARTGWKRIRDVLLWAWNGGNDRRG